MRPAVLLLATAVCLCTGPLSAADGPGLPAERPVGTGVIVHPDGYVLTAQHVVANARRVVVVTPGEFRAPAVLIVADAEQDLALLKIETVGLSEAPIGYAGAVKFDQAVIVIGFPFGLREVTVSRGRISAVRMKGVKRVFQVDAAINPGNSGGPVFTGEGELIGIVTTKFGHPSGIAPEGMGFAVPISYALSLLASIPDFDFTTIGKGRRESKTKGQKSPKKSAEGIVQDMLRMVVRIETLRAPDSIPAHPLLLNRPPVNQKRRHGGLRW